MRTPRPIPDFRRFDPTPRFRHNLRPPSFLSFPHAPPQISVVRTHSVVRCLYSLLASPVMHSAVFKDRFADDLGVFDESVLEMNATRTSLVNLPDLTTPRKACSFRMSRNRRTERMSICPECGGPRGLDERGRRTIIDSSPPDAAWLTNRFIDEHDFRSLQQFLN